jgi:ubiquitin
LEAVNRSEISDEATIPSFQQFPSFKPSEQSMESAQIERGQAEGKEVAQEKSKKVKREAFVSDD